MVCTTQFYMNTATRPHRPDCCRYYDASHAVPEAWQAGPIIGLVVLLVLPLWVGWRFHTVITEVDPETELRKATAGARRRRGWVVTAASYRGSHGGCLLTPAGTTRPHSSRGTATGPLS